MATATDVALGDDSHQRRCQEESEPGSRGERRHPAVRAVGQVAGRPEQQREQRRQPEPGDEQAAAGEQRSAAPSPPRRRRSRPARRPRVGSARGRDGPSCGHRRRDRRTCRRRPPRSPSPAWPADRSKRSVISSADQSFGGSSARAIAMPTRKSTTSSRRPGSGRREGRRGATARRWRSGSRKREATSVMTTSTAPVTSSCDSQRDAGSGDSAGRDAAGHRAERPQRRGSG